MKRDKILFLSTSEIDFQRVSETTIFDNIGEAEWKFSKCGATLVIFVFVAIFAYSTGQWLDGNSYIRIHPFYSASFASFRWMWRAVFPRFHHLRVDFVLDFETKNKKTRERKRKEKSKIDGAISNKIIKFPPIKRYGFVPYDFLQMMKILQISNRASWLWINKLELGETNGIV